MWRGKLSGLMICALALMAVVGRGDAAETTVKASAPINGEGRFYKATQDLLLFSGYFQGTLEVEGGGGDINKAALVCPGQLEINRTARMRQGEGRCIITTTGGDFLYARWSCIGKEGGACEGLLTVTGGTGKFSDSWGQSLFAMRSNVDNVVTTVPERDVTGTFTGQALWGALKYVTP